MGALHMTIEIRTLSPELVEDYLHFFDTTPHADNFEEHKCYCVWWCRDDSEGKDYSTPEKRREYAKHYIQTGSIQGYLAYCDGKVVGWCNANTKADCLQCYCWRRFMAEIPLEEPSANMKVKSILCYTIAPDMKRKGIASRLLAHVCQDAARDGFDYVEAYPNKKFLNDAEDYMGPVAMFIANGFTRYCETADKLVMRKYLKSSNATQA
jgi:GNAT superfamily N-acetyltransferase